MTTSLIKQFKKDISALCKPQGRLLGTPEHREARHYIIDRLRAIGIEPYTNGLYEFPYQAGEETPVNIAGIIRSDNSKNKPLLIGAHYDSIIAAPCADDNAAAVSIALCAAKTLLAEKLDKDVIVAIFDAEEPPYFYTEFMGSVRFYEDHLKQHGIEAALIMDLVGHDVVIPQKSLHGLGAIERLAFLFPKQNGQDVAFPLIRDLLFITGAESHPNFQNILQDTNIPLRLRILPTLNRYIDDMSDHGVFRTNNIPYLFLSCGRWPYYHMPTDTPEKLNYSKMARITKYLVGLTKSLSRTILPSISCVDDENLTVDFEIRSFKKVCGPLFPLVLKYLGIKKLSSREDINNLVSLILSTGV
jgi:hypothetical protein